MTEPTPHMVTGRVHLTCHQMNSCYRRRATQTVLNSTFPLQIFAIVGKHSFLLIIITSNMMLLCKRNNEFN